MSKFRATQDLPENYRQIGKLDLNENRGWGMILNLAGIGVLFGVGWLLVKSLAVLRPAYLSEENILIITGMREFWRGVLLLVLSVGLMIVLNEGMRWVLFWVFTGQRPSVGFRGFYTYAAAPEWYLTRNLYAAIRLAPAILITVLGVLAVMVVPLNLVPGVLLLVSLNLAAALSDAAMVWWAMRKPKGALVLDYGDGIRVYHTQANDGG